MAENSDGTLSFLETTIKYEDEGWIPVRSPGIGFYAREILANRPFSFVRYGEGEWRVMHPDLGLKRHPIYSEWKDEEAQDRLRATLANYHKHPRYWPALWHQRWYDKDNHMGKVKGWLREHDASDIPWHDGRVWRRATERDTGSIIINALRKQPLPLVFVGPPHMECVQRRFKGCRFIEIHYAHAYYDIDEIEKTILKIKEPALISFSAGGTAKIMIHDLFPKIGEWSFMIDFGAFWEGLCGRKARVYQRGLTPERLKKNWQREEKVKLLSGWLKPAEHKWLSEQAAHCKRVLEVGSYHGRSTTALLNAGHVWCVDLWGTEAVGETDYQEFMKNMAPWMHRIDVLRGDSHEMLDGLIRDEVGPFDLAFIDGCHKYKFVRGDIARCLKLVREGGILCGHDYNEQWPDVVRAVNELVPGFKRVKGTGLWWKVL